VLSDASVREAAAMLRLQDWRKVLREATGEDISTRAMMDYFKPLMSWLEEQNKDRQIGWE